MHSYYVGVCNDLLSKNLDNKKNTYFLQQKKINFFTIVKNNMSPILTMVGHCRQGNIIYK